MNPLGLDLTPRAAADPLSLFESLPVGDGGARWDLDQSPWVRAVFDWWNDPAVQWIYLIQGSQTSKTTTMMGLLLYVARNDPGPTIWVSALEEEADKFVLQRLKPFLEAADPAIRTKRKRDWRARELRLYGTMLCHVAWATSGRRLRSWPCRYVFGDECGIWPASIPDIGDPLDYVKKRTRRFRNRKGIFATTPSSDEHPAWVAASRAAFAQWWVPCPECGEFQFLSFDSLRFGHCKDGKRWDYGRVLSDTYYECVHCKARLTDRHKLAMIKAGRAEYVDPQTNERVEPDASNPSRTLHVPATYSLFTRWGELAYAFLEAKHKGRDALRVFITDELAEPYREDLSRPEERALAACIDEDRAPGTVPPGTIALLAGCDVQKGWLVYVVRAFGRDMVSWLVEHGVLPWADDGTINTLDSVLFRQYGEARIRRMFVDSGAFTDVVYRYCLRARGLAVPSKGASGRVRQGVTDTALKDQGGLRLFLIDTSLFKEFIHDHILLAADAPGAWRLHNRVDAEYMRQILAEGRVMGTKPGQPVRWVQRPGVANHYLDAEVMALANAWKLGIMRYTAHEIPRGPLPAAAAPKVVAPVRSDSSAWKPRPMRM